MITGSSAKTIDSKVFLGSSQFKGELVRGGVPTDKIIIPAYGNQAYPLIRECETPIRAAVLYENNDPERISALHSSLRHNNPHVQIYHLVHQDYIRHFEYLQKDGLARLTITGLLPLIHKGEPDHNPLYLLGKELQGKYFSPK